MKDKLLVFGAGLLFGAGLTISQMVNPEKVLAFLDVSGNWDPSLAFVMGGALAVCLITFRLILKRATPLWADEFSLPGRSDIDRPLLLGATLFGIGWGIGGYCPGPAIASLGFGLIEPLVVTISIIAGIYLHQCFNK